MWKSVKVDAYLFEFIKDIPTGKLGFMESNEKTNIMPVNIYMYKVNTRSIKTRCKACSKLTIKTSGSFWCLYC